MQQEHSFSLTVPLSQLTETEEVLLNLHRQFRQTRISRKPDRNGCARFYISLPFSGAGGELALKEWLDGRLPASCEVFGPTYGRWGLC